MTGTASNALPSLIVVTGEPGSGKTTLTPLLAKAVRCPAISRDEIKEGLINTTGESGKPGDDVARVVYEAFFDVMELLLRRRVTLIAEAAFQHQVWAPKLQPLRQIAHIRIIHCTIDPNLARSRHIARSQADRHRQRFHHDRELHFDDDGRERPLQSYDPPRLDVPTLTVDTSDGYQPAMDRIIAFARG